MVKHCLQRSHRILISPLPLLCPILLYRYIYTCIYLHAQSLGTTLSPIPPGTTLHNIHANTWPLHNTINQLTRKILPYDDISCHLSFINSNIHEILPCNPCCEGYTYMAFTYMYIDEYMYNKERGSMYTWHQLHAYASDWI